jgi:hypothetical protein
MRLARASLAFSVWLAASSMLAPGCGGAVAPLEGEDGGSSGGGSGSGGSGSGGSSGGGSSGGSSGSSSGGHDGGLVEAGVCQVDGVPCISSAQCCSGACQNQVCVGLLNCLPDGATCSTGSQCCANYCSHGQCGSTVPTCVADGGACKLSSDCCSGACASNVCQGPPPPPTCAPSPKTNQCDQCLVTQCAGPLVACESDPTCCQEQACFDGCYAGPGSGAACAQKCSSQYPSAAGANLLHCATQSCVSICQ